ncbi:MAG: manganese efflux pump MntP family protein [Desulfobacterales bacterium]|nr:manganese efflux pump MntP family protein [Desulfobacterales bacterium]
MNIWEIGLIAVSLGCDAFAVGLGVGTRCCAPRQIFRLSFHFGLFQFLMPILGWLLGRNVLGWTAQWGPWIAFGLLFGIGVKMAYEGTQPREKEDVCADPTKGFSLVMLSFATSIDALGVGFSLGVLGQSLFVAAVCIGITAGAMTWIAMKVGNSLSGRFAQRMEIVGGLILIAIAFKLLFL